MKKKNYIPPSFEVEKFNVNSVILTESVPENPDTGFDPKYNEF